MLAKTKTAGPNIINGINVDELTALIEGVTMNGTRWAMRPATKATSRESRSSLETRTGHLAARAVANAAG